jgi:hypothetical protein
MESFFVLAHLGQCLAAYPITALKVRLALRKIYRPPCQCAFLENPTALVERSFDDVFVEVVDCFGDVEGLFAAALEGYVGAGWTGA